ncbi:CHAT domain-containing protein [Arthrobacter sp. I2-34]|uniref:CHAT domain-containing protein n=1 Tax=Arthrobacter hankyongi TaxID=2904801 RepID=A0ABS9LD14_9MICC|nr:trypco2 family protein [Arthrobacter hankyongi]MCG2624337.1 CHAT domain-containing protein [Arthrobacter hankyongi]
MVDAAVGLAEAIDALREELSAAAARSEGQAMRFGLEPVELTLQVALTRTAAGKVAWVVVDSGAGHPEAVTQMLTLKLVPLWKTAEGSLTTDFTIASPGAADDGTGRGHDVQDSPAAPAGDYVRPEPGEDKAMDRAPLDSPPVVFRGGLLGAEQEESSGPAWDEEPQRDTSWSEPEGPAAPAASGEADDRRWVSAELEDHDPAAPLLSGETYTLAFGVDVEENPRAAANTLLGYTFAAGENLAVLSVHVESDDFDIGDNSRPLRLPRSGPSKGKARFDITPLRDGPCVVTATIHKEGNFIQEMEITFHVGLTARPVQVTARGRPSQAAFVLQPRDIGLSIEPAPGGGFRCDVRGAVYGRAHLPIQDAELADALKQLRTELLKVVTQTDDAGTPVFQQRLDIADADRDRALVVLAKAGYGLYRKIFYHPAADAQTKRIGDWLREQTAPESGVTTLQVVSQGFPIPWGLLYVADKWDENGVQWERFLGMGHVIEQIPLQNDMATPDGVIATDRPDLSLSVNINDEIDTQMRADFVARQGRYWADTCRSRAGIRLTTRRLGNEVIRALQNEATDDQILYLYCHAGAAGLDDPGGPDASWLKFSGNEKVRLEDLNLTAPTDVPLRGHPLIFINACESAELSPLFYDGFVPYFMAKGARGVIGTECKTPALFAAEWAKRFFDMFMDGVPLGELFLKLRREMYLDHGNPLGLLYGVHCDGDTYLKPAVPSLPAVGPG